MNINFEFFKIKYKDLYEDMLSAMELSVLSPDITVYKIRKCLEQLIRNINKFEFIPDEQKLGYNLQKLSHLGILSKEIFFISNKLREIGNKGVHNRFLDRYEAELAINLFFRFSIWYLKKYDIETYNEWVSKFNDDDINNRFLKSVSDNDKKFFNAVLELLDKIIRKLIVDKELGGYGTISSIEFLSFENYLDYYYKGLDIFININDMEAGLLPEGNLKVILKFKEIARKKFGIDDNYKLNLVIANILYKQTHWSWILRM